MKTAKLTAVAVEVDCPYCGEGQPDPDGGSFLWEVRTQFAQAREAVCVFCERRFKIVRPKRVAVP